MVEMHKFWTAWNYSSSLKMNLKDHAIKWNTMKMTFYAHTREKDLDRPKFFYLRQKLTVYSVSLTFPHTEKVEFKMLKNKEWGNKLQHIKKCRAVSSDLFCTCSTQLIFQLIVTQLQGSITKYSDTKYRLLKISRLQILEAELEEKT